MSGVFMVLIMLLPIAIIGFVIYASIKYLDLKPPEKLMKKINGNPKLKEAMVKLKGAVANIKASAVKMKPVNLRLKTAGNTIETGKANFQVVNEKAQVNSVPLQRSPISRSPIEREFVDRNPMVQNTVGNPINRSPIDRSPAETVPIQRTPIQRAPYQSAPFQSAPLQNAAFQRTSVAVAEPEMEQTVSQNVQSPSMDNIQVLVTQKVTHKKKKMKSEIVQTGFSSVFLTRTNNVIIIPYARDVQGKGRAMDAIVYLKYPFLPDEIGVAVRKSIALSEEAYPFTDKELMSSLNVKDWADFTSEKKHLSIKFDRNCGFILNTTSRNPDGSYRLNCPGGIEKIVRKESSVKELGDMVLGMIQRCKLY